jgi:plasmid stabilization system protein ParE
MRIVVAPAARRDLESQLTYLIDQGAGPAARRLEQRLVAFVERTLAAYPRVGTSIGHRDVWEVWIPGTRLVLWYRFTASELQIIRIWHASQDRDRRP